MLISNFLGGNFLRVLDKTQKISAKMRGCIPDESRVPYKAVCSE